MLELSSLRVRGSAGLLRDLGRQHPVALSSCLCASRNPHGAYDVHEHGLLGVCTPQHVHVRRNRKQHRVRERPCARAVLHEEIQEENRI